MSRCRAIEWLFWHHARERWERNRGYTRGFRDGLYFEYPETRPSPDNWWTKWVLG